MARTLPAGLGGGGGDGGAASGTGPFSAGRRDAGGDALAAEGFEGAYALGSEGAEAWGPAGSGPKGGRGADRVEVSTLPPLVGAEQGSPGEGGPRRSGARGRLVPGRAEEAATVERWLDAVTAGPTAPTGAGGLKDAGLDREALGRAGLGPRAADRLYRGLHASALGLDAALAEAECGGWAGPELKQRAVTVMSRIVGKGAKRVVDDQIAAPTTVRADPAGVQGGTADEDVEFLVEARGAFELRGQALQRTIEEERRRCGDIQDAKLEVEAELLRTQNLVEQERQSMRDLQVLHQSKVDQADRYRQMYQGMLTEAETKLNEEVRVSGLLKAELEESGTQLQNLAKAKENVESSLQDMVKQRDDLIAEKLKLEYSVDDWKDKLKRKMESFRQDMERFQQHKQEYLKMQAELGGLKVKFDEEETKSKELSESNHTLMARLEERDKELSVAQTELKGATSQLAVDREALETQSSELKEVKDRNEILEEVRIKYEYALELNGVLQAKLEKQCMFSEDERNQAAMLVKKCGEDLHTIRASEEKLEEELDASQKKATKQAGEIKHLEDLVVAHKEQCDSLTTQLDINSDAMARAEAASEEYQKIMHQMHEKDIQSEKTIKKQDKDLKARNREIAKLNASIDSITNKLEELTRQWNDEKSELNSKVNDLTHDKTQLQIQVDEMTPKVEELEDVKNALEDTHEKYKRSLEEVDHFSTRYEHAERERNDLVKTLESTEETLKEAEVDRDQYLKDFKQCRREKEAGAAYAQNLMMDFERTKASLEKLNAEYDTLSKNHDATSIDLDVNIRERASLQKIFKELQAEHMELQAKLEFASEEGERMSGELERKQLTIVELQKCMERTIDTFTKERKEMEEINKQLLDQFQTLWAEIGEDAKERAEISETAMGIQQQIKVAEATLVRDSETHEATKRTMLELEDQIRQQMEEAENQKAQALMKKLEEEKAEAEERAKFAEDFAVKRKKDEEDRKRQMEENMEKSNQARKEMELMWQSDVAKARDLMKLREEELQDVINNLKDQLSEEFDAHNSEKEKAINAQAAHKQAVEQQRVAERRIEEVLADSRAAKRNHDAELTLVQSELDGLEKKLEAEANARKWRDKYVRQLSNSLQEAKLDIIRLGRIPIVHAKSTQTQYCELWSRNLPESDDDDDFRKSWTRTSTGKWRGKMPSLARIKRLLKDVYATKVSSDMHSARAGREPATVPEAAYDCFKNRYVIEEQVRRHLWEFSAGVEKYCGQDPEVGRFATLSSMGAGSAPAAAAVGGSSFLLSAGVPKNYLKPTPGQSMDHHSIASTNSDLLCVDYERLRECLDLGLASKLEKFIPTYVPESCVEHRILEAATSQALASPGVEATVNYMANPAIVPYVAARETGFLVSEEQLPQMHLLLVEACDILGLDYPGLYIRPGDGHEAHSIALPGLLPRIVLSSKLVESLTPRELQAVIAHQLTPQVLRGHSVLFHNISNACGLKNLVKDALLTMDGARGHWATSIKPSLSRWEQFAHVVADRVALLVVQDVGILVSAIAKWSIGSRALATQIDPTSLIEQARGMNSSVSKQLEQLMYEADTAAFVRAKSSLTLLRIRELLKFAESDEYAILKKESRPYLVEGHAREGPREATLRKAAIAEGVVQTIGHIGIRKDD